MKKNNCSSDMKIIQAKFYPAKGSQPLPDLAAAINSINQSRLTHIQQNKELRINLAAKLRKLRNQTRTKLKQQADRREKYQLEKSLFQLQKLTESTYRDCQLDALNTIKAVCISVFSEYPESCNQLLESALKIAFNKIDKNRIIELQLPEALLTKFPELRTSKNASPEACIKFASGNLIINPLTQLAAGFDGLNEKIEAMTK